MEKINIFWIEDNMLFGSAKGASDRIKDWKEKLPDNNLFELTLFQNPIEIKEYLELKTSIITTDDMLERCPHNVPDIVVFDYKLSDSFKASNDNAFDYHHNEFSSRRASERFINSYNELSNFNQFSGVQSDADKIKSFARDISKKEGEISNLDDEFGLFCGLSIIREFKDFITCGVPASVFKSERGVMNHNSAFYEWLNEYDLKDALDKDKRESKDLKNNIIPFAVKLLRKRIITQIKNKSIIINLDSLQTNLNFYKDTNNISQIYNSSLGFDSNYGYKELCFKALFNDCSLDQNLQSDKKTEILNEIENEIIFIKKNTKITNKDKELLLNELCNKKSAIEFTTELQFEVWVFLNDILESLQIKNYELNNINEACSKLWNAYLNDFESRIELSDLYVRLKNKENLSTLELNILENHLSKFKVDHDDKIDKTEVVSIENFRFASNQLKLIVGILVTRFHIEMIKRITKFGVRNIYSQPDEIDIYIILNPINNSSNGQNLIHPIHLMGKDMPEQSKKFGPTIIGDFGTKLSRKGMGESSSKFYQMCWFENREKAIIKSFFSKDKKYYPNWLY